MKRRTVLPAQFFKRPTLKVARDLLGKFLIHKFQGKNIARMVTEVEAYDGFRDKASHAYRGKTERNKYMFGRAGTWYVYFTYGMHWMLNVVTGNEGYPAAVLIRGVTGFAGPARLTKFLKIDKKYTSKPADKKNGLWIEDRGVKIKNSEILCVSRIGVEYAKEWAKKPYRFIIKIYNERNKKTPFENRKNFSA